MPINIPNDLPAWDTLEQENIFIMSAEKFPSFRKKVLDKRSQT